MEDTKTTPENVAISNFLGKGFFLMKEIIILAHKIKNNIMVIKEIKIPNKIKIITPTFLSSITIISNNDNLRNILLQLNYFVSSIRKVLHSSLK